MTEIVQSMFGLTPMQIQQQRQQENNAAAADFARMNATQRGVMGLYQGGAGVGGMLGLKDPQMEQAQQMAQAQQGIDLTTPAGLKAAALKFQQIGNTQAAVGLLDRARAMENDVVANRLKNAQADKAEMGPEYERMMAILEDPMSTDEEKRIAKERIDALNTRMRNIGRSGAGTQSGRLVSTSQGLMVFDPVTKTLKPFEGQEGLQMAQYDPLTMGNVAQAESGGKAVGAEQGKAQVTIPDAELAMKTVNRHLDELLSHPGFASAVGMGIPKAKLIPGTKEAGFAARLDQLKGGAFLQAFNMLRGGGQITEIEGTKATQAMLRMDDATSEVEFRAAAEDYRQALKDGIEKLRAKSTMQYALPASAPAAEPTEVPKFSGVTNPNQVRAMFKAGKLNRDQAKAILGDMKERGLF